MWVFDVHYINTTDEALLMEGWVNVKTVLTPKLVLGYFQLSGGTQMSVAPKTTGVVEIPATACPLPSDISVVSISGHQHSHGRRLSIYAAGRSVYSNFDWEHALTAQFNSTVTNPRIDGATRTSGATSGVLSLGKNQGISWECEIENTRSASLRYGSSLTESEMCAVAGLYVPPNPTGRSWSCTAQ